MKTLSLLKSLGVAHAGYGKDAFLASAPAFVTVRVGGEPRKVAVLSYADHFAEWACGEATPGINYFDFQHAELRRGAGGNPNRYRTHRLDRIRRDIAACLRTPGCAMVVVSMHWGDNFVEEMPDEFRDAAREMVAAGATIVHGHSSHHILGVEIVKCARNVADPGGNDPSDDLPPSDSDSVSDDGSSDGDESTLHGAQSTGLVLYGLGGAVDDYGAAARVLPDADDFEQFARHRSDIGMGCVVRLKAGPAGGSEVELASATLVALKISDLGTTSIATGSDAEWFERKLREASPRSLDLTATEREGFFNLAL